MDLSPDDDNFQGRLLHQAALWDNVELLQELISSGADVEARDCSGRTALHAAALADRSRCLAALCRAGAEVDARPDHAAGGKTALHIAAERGHVENVRVLLRAGADLSARDAAGDSALDLADRNNWRHAANELRDHRDALERERLSQHSALRELVSRGDVAQLKARLAALGNNAGLIVNMTPGGANTLLYVSEGLRMMCSASESGQCAAVGALLAVGADGRAHPATRYGPLYIACYHGHLDVARTLLQHFPEAVQQETVEKWLPLHAACMGGHASLVSLLLDFHYPEHLLVTYTERRSQQRYLCPVDVNARDAAGHTPLSRALHCPAAVDALLAFSVPVLESEESVRDAGKTSSPQRGLAHGIHAIVAKLTAASRQETESVRRVHPVDADVAVGGDSCLARAVRAGDVRLVRRLLQAGAAPDAPATLPQESEKSREVRRRSRSTSALSRASSAERETEWTALALATRCKQVSLAEVLLAGGASDPRGLAAREAARGLLPDLLAKLLATKAYPDPEYKLNRSQLSEAVLSARDGDSALSYSAACPSVPVMITWRDLQCQLATLKMQWVGAACMRVNPRVGGARAALMALTRLDVSGNDLTALPPELMTLASLRYLNAAQNKLDCLPRASDAPAPTRSGRKPKAPPPAIYTAPVLQELYLQDNRLEELPPELFQLPALQTLDVSNNKLRVLPAAMWTAPALKDLNAAFNLLRDLPTGDEDSCNKVQKSPASGPRSPDAKGQKTSPSESSSRSPSIEHSESESGESDDSPVVIANRSGNTMCSDSSGPHSWRGAVCGGGGSGGGGGGGGGGGLRALSVAHNQLGGVPAALACRAPNLHRLNMAYNSLRSMSYVTSYPTSLRQLDLSHNEITCWPSLPQIETYSSAEGDPLACYCPTPTARPRPKSGGSVRTQLLNAACPARRHLRLEGLRTLILSNNLLTRIQLTTDDDGEFTEPTLDQNDDEWGSPRGLRAKLLFPLLSMLDVSCNLLRSIPPSIHELTNLAVLNISGNKDITELPPQLGLLSRLWSLSAEGCGLGEPLRSMVRAGGCRARLVGLLRAQLTAARPYARLRLVLAGAQGIGKTSLLECLRQESAIHHRRKPTDHWAKRMGNKASRGNLSTVGVDIGTWVYEKPRSNRGPITFRTWDFGGQKEYYATHQYFLSRRSLYLVVWKVTDGRKGLAEALNWLRSIQARAPGSHVIMVATHYDQVGNCKLPESESPEALQRVVRGSVMGAPDADKRGLPRVADSLEVSCSTRHNIRLLADIIYSVAFSIKTPGSKEPLLLTPVPASFVALEECVVQLARDLQHPVLTHHQYTAQVTQYMQQKNLRMFRDAAELHQATMFLHENGILLHYDDATLKELYFLNPQWLCDLLAHVVTVREINPFVNNGVMRTEDLSLVFKASPLLGGGEEGLALLHKFELALGWDPRLLLVPPLLPDRAPPTPQLWLRTRSRGSRGTPHRAWPAAGTGLTPVPPLKEPDSSAQTSGWQCAGVSVEGRAGAGEVRRVVLLSYVPRGFWPRLTARLLAHPACTHLAHALYSPPPELELDETVSKALELNWGWTLWKTGMRLSCGELTLLNLQELDGEANGQDVCYNDKYRVWSEGGWGELEAGCWARVELHLPAHTAVLRRQDSQPIAGYQSISLEPNPEVLAKVLASVTDHIDLLLEDWYPSLGTRFVHTSEGRCLITRLATCPQCARDSAPPHPPLGPDPLLQELRQMGLGVDVRPRVSADSRTSDGDSGVGAESNASSRVGSVEGVVEEGGEGREWGVCAWPLEECILAACGGRPLACPRHPALQLRDLAPDTLLLDVEEERRARWEQVSRGSVVGRGAFGTVLAGTWRPRPGRAPLPVAIKVLQPVPPPAGADVAAHQAYKAGLSRWRREPVSAACRAYCGLRQELAVLVSVHHPHVVPLLAVCPRPLALLLAVAPRGALDGMLREYRGRGVRVGERAVRAIALQLARALEYLHSNRILYRDLKSENVLVWSMPAPQDAQAAELSAAPIDLHIKLGDYGISRSSLPSGTKGFGGTEGFMAPEIMRYNGEEEYNEKVDCFSYGMVLYELLSLRQPFEGHEAVKEAILEGTRPALTARELWYPCNMVETMRRCWSGRADGRPSAGALVSLVAAPEWLALATVATCNTAATGATCNTAASGATCNTAASGANCNTEVTAAVAVPIADTADEPGGWEVWRGGEGRAHSLLAARTGFTRQHTLPLHTEDGAPVTVTAMCRVGSKLWLGDSSGDLSVYSASSCALCWRVRVCVVVGAPPSPAAALQPLAPPRLALALRSGRLFLVSTQRPADEGSFVLTELGTATELCCLAAVYTPIGVEVWAGGDGLHAYRVSAGGVCGADSLSTCSVRHLAAHSRTPLILAAGTGPCVYQWSAVTREQTAKLDCSKLVPCSESLRSLEDLPADQGQITALCVVGGRVYVGVGGGVLLVADAASLRPLTVCRPYREHISCIVPLISHEGSPGPHMVATFGTDYRPLLQRFAPHHQEKDVYPGTYCLLWRAHHWLPD